MRVSSLHKQSGVVVMLLFLILFVTGATVALSALNNRTPGLKQSLDLTRELEEAKEALLGYALLYPQLYGDAFGPGRLPCPDTNNNGLPNSPCIATAILGRLPRQDVIAGNPYNFSDYNSGIDQQFWYAVAPLYRQSIGLLNSLSAAPLTLDSSNDIVAVIIAPGPALVGQTRPHNSQAARYLEGENTSSPTFITNDSALPNGFNDRVVTIQRAELMTLVTARVAQVIKVQLDAYHNDNGQFPELDADFRTALITLATPPAWLETNDWDDVAVTTYTYVNDNQATIEFVNCDIDYTINFGGEITRSQTTCGG